MWVLIEGSPFSGFSIWGPFTSREDAVLYAHENMGTNWDVGRINIPEREEEE